MKDIKAYWKCHTPNLLNEILNNNGMAIFEKPLNIFGKMLAQVADRAVEINDLELNKLMIRLSLYESADPSSNNYLGDDAIEEYLSSEKNLISTMKENQLKMLKTMDIEVVREFINDKGVTTKRMLY